MSLTGAAMAVDFPEVEPNDTKFTAQVIVGMQPGDTITGLTTGTSTTTSGDTSSDNFDITTAAAPMPGIYRYRLVITTLGTAGHTGTIRGLTQTAGVINPGTDSVLQTSSTTSSPPRFVQWYANEQPSRLIYRVTGTTSTTSPYTVTLEREEVIPNVVPTPITAGGVFFSTIDQTTADTDIWVYDSGFNAIPLAGNDDNTVAGGGTGAGLTSYLQRYFAPGTYYLAVANYNLANDQPLPPIEERGPADPVTDFPNVLLTSSTAINADNDFLVGHTCVGSPESVSNTRVGIFDVTIWQVNLVGPPIDGPISFSAGSATPANVSPGGSTVLSVTVNGGVAAPGTVTADLSAFGLSGAEVFTDADLDGVWTYTLNIPMSQATGGYDVVVVGPVGACGSPPTRTIRVTIPIDGDACETALAITPGVPEFGNNSLATNETPAPPTCSGLTTFNLGVWYRFTAANSNAHEVTTCGLLTDFNTRVYVYSGSCGALTCVNANATASPACGFRSDAATARFCATPGTTYYILVTNDTTGSGNFELLVTDTGIACPGNDNCSGAEPIAVGQTVIGDTAFASNETPAPPTCNGLVTFNLGLWYTFTEGATARRLSISTCDASTTFNTRVYVYTGSCGAFTCVNANATASPACGVRSDAATVTFCSTPFTQYYFLVTNDTTGVGTFGLSLSDTGVGCAPPPNDDCANGIVMNAIPFNASPFVDAANSDIDVSCNAAANIDSRAGVWYRYTPIEDGSFAFTETGPADVIFTVFTGGPDCSGLTEVFCNTNETGTVLFPATTGTLYHILVSMASNTAVIPSNYAISINYIGAPGACCVGTNCAVTNGSAACATLGGTFLGTGTSCGGTGYPITVGGSAYSSIAATGIPSSAGNCDDCGETVSLPFTFNFLDGIYSDVWICSNGFIQFGGANNTTFTNAVIPTAGIPNNIVCPLWDDLNPLAAGDVYYQADGVSPNQTFTVSWENCTQFSLTTSESFQVVLFENGNIEFRYGGITPEATLNDYTVGYENSTGTEGMSYPGADLGSGNVSLTLTRTTSDNPCSTPATGACCCGSSCRISTAAQCASPGQAFSGGGTVCTPYSFTSPCCRADYNKAPGTTITVQDVFDFLTGYFTNDPCANTDDSITPIATNGVSVQDIFDFLGSYFGPACP